MSYNISRSIYVCIHWIRMYLNYVFGNETSESNIYHVIIEYNKIKP